jgi:phasin family protein
MSRKPRSRIRVEPAAPESRERDTGATFRPGPLIYFLIHINFALENGARRFLQRSIFAIDIHCALHHLSLIKPPYEKGFKMTEQFKTGEQFQKAGKEGFDAIVRAYGQANKGFQAIAAEVTDYSKTAFEDATRAFQQLVSAKSAEQAFEIQSQYAKKAYDAYLAEMSKLGEMWVDLARDAYKPVERVVAK